MSSARERVLSLLRAAARLAYPEDPLGREARDMLPGLTGLSREGVELGFRAHWEAHASEAEVASLVASVEPAPRVHVILSANVFVGALRAMALALAASPEVYVRPSRREPLVATLLARALDEAGGDTRVHIVDTIAPQSGDEVHVYGRDETIREVKKNVSPDVHVRGHGTGFGVAVLEKEADPIEAAKALAWDVVPFDQRGCLSPRIVLAKPEVAEVFARALADALRALDAQVPRGTVFEEERTAAATWMSTMAMAGDIHAGPWGAIGLDVSSRSLLLPPTGRHVHVTAVRDAEHLSRLLTPLARFVTTLGGGEGPLTEAARRLVPGARVASFGRMQRPPLDGPVDRRRG